MQLKSYLRGFGCGLFMSAVLMGIAFSYSRNTMSDEEIKLRAAELGMVEEDSVLVRPSEIESPAPTPVVRIETEGKDAPKNEDKSAENNTDAGAAGNPEEESTEVTDNTEETGTEASDKTEEPADDEEEASDPDNTVSDTESTEEPAGTENTKKTDEYADEDRLAAMGMNKSSDENKTVDESADVAKTDPGTEENLVKTSESYTLEISKGATSDSVSRLLKQGGLIDNPSDFDNYLCKNGYDKRIQDGVFKIPAGAGYEEIAKIITRSK